MWFPRELSWREKKHQKKTLNSGSHSHTWDTRATFRERQEINPEWDAAEDKVLEVGLLSDNFQWKLDTHMQPLSGLPLPSYQSPLVEETSSDPCGAAPCRRSWKQLRRSDSWTNSEPGGKSLLMRAWNMCFSPALRNSDRVPLLLAGGGGDCQCLLEEEKHISYQGGKPIRFFLII